MAVFFSARLLPLCLVAACSPAGGTPEWLVGRWAVDRQTCEDAWLVYSSDGTWRDRYNKGTWSVQGEKLTLSHTHMADGLGPEPAAKGRRVTQPLCHTESVERVGVDALRTRWEDGSTHRLARCVPTEIRFPKPACIGDCEPVTPFDFKPWNLGQPAATTPCSGK